MGYARYVGRVGALAVMLGVGTAIAAPAWADDGSSATGKSASSSSPPSASKSGGPRHGAQATSNRRTSSTAINGPKKATGATDPVIPQKTSVPLAPKGVQSLVRVSTLKAVSPVLPPGPSAPAQSEAVWAMLGVARRPTGESDAPATAAAPPAATTTVTIGTWNQLVTEVAKYGGYISSPTAGTWQNGVPATVDDTSWTLKNTYLAHLDDAYTDDFFATQTAYTYSTPYTQNAFVQSQLKNNALALHLTYSAANYTAYLVATSPTDPGTISGGKQLTIGDAIVHPAPITAFAPDGNGGFSMVMPSTTDPNWQSSYSVVILPKNVVPVFPGGDITAPKAPTVASPKQTPSSVSLKISAFTDDVAVTGYNVYRIDTVDYGQGGIQTTIYKVNPSAVPAGTTFVDTDLEPETTYVYTVRAVDAAGHESLDSALLVVKTPAEDTEPPTTPTITAGTVTSTSVTLHVSGSTDNIGVDGYDIYRDGLQLNTAPIKAGESFIDTDLDAGTEYTYTAQAFDAAGNRSEESQALLVTTTGSTGGGGDGGGNGGGNGGGEVTPLPVPGIKASNITDTSVEITLVKAKPDNRVVQYFLYRNGEPIALLHNLGDSYVDINLDSDVTYTYTAQAIDADNHFGEPSRKLNVTTYSEEEWEIVHGKSDSLLEKYWEKFNTTVGWLPLVGDALGAISLGIDIGQLLNAIARRDKQQMFDELKDMGGDLIGFIPFAKLVDKQLAKAIEEALQKPGKAEVGDTIVLWLTNRLYEATVPPR